MMPRGQLSRVVGAVGVRGAGEDFNEMDGVADTDAESTLRFVKKSDLD